jgi:hypothetical protein
MSKQCHETQPAPSADGAAPPANVDPSSVDADPIRSRLSQSTLDFLDDISPDDEVTGAVVEEQHPTPRIRKPGSNEFFQTFPDWRLSVRLYFTKEDGKSGTAYVVSKRMADNEALPSVVTGVAVLSLSRKNALFFQLLRLPDSSDPHPAHVSMHSAIDASRSQWVRVHWSKDRNEYRLFRGQTETAVNWSSWLGETPEMRSARAAELFREAVVQSGRYIDSPNHPVMLTLLDITAPGVGDPLA